MALDRALGTEARQARLAELGAELMAAVGRVVPALPVSLLGTALLEREGPVSTLELHARTQALGRRLAAAGAHVHLPREDEAYAIDAGVRTLAQRRLMAESGGGWTPLAAERPVLRSCAAAIAALLAAPAQK